ncbi:MAG: hypothetical protein ACFE85_16750 [Candidatus Hodarchaeota archaeon]
MKIDCSNKRSGLIIAGILGIVAILIGFALVVGVSEIYSQEDILPLDERIYNNTEINTFKGNTDVSVGKGDCIYGVPTAAGSISDSSYYFPPITWTELPLCITDADIASWYINLTVVGGYEPVCGTIKFTQEGVDQYINIGWTETEYCCYSVWTATFTTDDGCIKFDSSEAPNINLPFPYSYCGDGFAEKLVDICWCTGWVGCDFYILLTHKSVLPGSPTPENNFIASCKQ